jgi:hypothetical protein
VGGFSDLALTGHAKVALVYARRNGAVTNEDLRTLRALESCDSRAVLHGLVARGLLEPVGRGRGTRYVLGEVARTRRGRADLDQQVEAVVAHARRSGAIANRDVRGLLGVDRATALAVLEAAVARDLLEAVGEGAAGATSPLGDRGHEAGTRAGLNLGLSTDWTCGSVSLCRQFSSGGSHRLPRSHRIARAARSRHLPRPIAATAARRESLQPRRDAASPAGGAPWRLRSQGS